LGHVELVILLLEQNADVVACDRNGNTPLHKAASKGHRDIVEILVEKGSDLRAKNTHGNTPLEVAATPQIRKVLEGKKHPVAMVTI
jgi:ankyrin repeat protein